MLWGESWIDVPEYESPDNAVSIRVELSVPIVRLENPSGRVTRQPLLKVATFFRTDGPRSTLRKVRTKRQEGRFTGDFRVALFLGRTAASQTVIALGCRVPPACQQIAVHRDLVKEIQGGCTPDELLRAASFLASKRALLLSSGRQNYLYSAMTPPSELVSCLEEAIEQRSATQAPPVSDLASIRPPERGDRPTGTALLLNRSQRSARALPVALLGSGDYARTEVIPALRAAALSLFSVSNREPQIAATVGREYGFSLATTDSERAIAELPGPGLVVVATAHDSHARLASIAAAAGHRVFVEKPPTVTADDVRLLTETMTSYPGMVEIGFNRRYHPLVLSARSRLRRDSGPISMTCTVKEIDLESDHWYLWPNQGTRITGNLCHWIDLAVFFLEGSPMPVSLTMSPRVSDVVRSVDEERALIVTFEDQSLLSIFATSRGDDIRGVQEQIEIRKGGTTIAIDDLWKMRARSDGRDRRSRRLFRQKGHADMYRAALRRMVRGEASRYPPQDMVMVSAIQIAASELARSNRLVGEIPAWAPLMLDTARKSV